MSQDTTAGDAGGHLDIVIPVTPPGSGGQEVPQDTTAGDAGGHILRLQGYHQALTIVVGINIDETFFLNLPTKEASIRQRFD